MLVRQFIGLKLTQKLNLTTKEAQLFWPVYNEYLDKIEALKNA
jgi:hypothetical protein